MLGCSKFQRIGLNLLLTGLSCGPNCWVCKHRMGKKYILGVDSLMSIQDYIGLFLYDHKDDNTRSYQRIFSTMIHSNLLDIVITVVLTEAHKILELGPLPHKEAMADSAWIEAMQEEQKQTTG
ncbi:hypothetical protein Tco_1369771 [Tanacetum coccineum]